MPLHVLQFSDTHLLNDVDGKLLGCRTQACFQAVLERMRTPPSDLVLLTGDLVQDASREGYRRVTELVRPLGAPCYALPGNHDDPDLLADTLSEPPFHAERNFEAGGWRFLILNSHVPSETYGRLSAETLRWLDGKLAAHPEQPTLIALHHPPTPVGAPWLDRIILHEPEAFGEIVGRHDQVRLVLSGHVHQEHEATWHGATVLTAPSTCFQFKPGADHFKLDRDAAPGGRRLQLHPDGSFETSVVRAESASCMPDQAATGY